MTWDLAETVAETIGESDLVVVAEIKGPPDRPWWSVSVRRKWRPWTIRMDQGKARSLDEAIVATKRAVRTLAERVAR